MNYSQYVTEIGDLLQYQITDPSSATPFVNNDANNILSSIIEYAELRMYREYDFLSTITTNTGTLTSSSRNYSMPSAIVVLQSANVITPASTAPDSGMRNPLQRVSIEYLNFTYPGGSTGVPQYYALNQAALSTNPNPDIRLAPTPDATYEIEFLGTQRPAALSSTNTTTFLTLNLPDVFKAASMVYGVGFQRDFGAQSSDPQMGLSWENTYQALKAGSMTEELRKKAQSQAWTPYLPSPLAPRS